MLLSRTRRNLTHKAKEWAFKFGNMQSMLDENEKRLLEQSMGFPGQWDEHRRFQLQFLKDQGLTPAHRFLEIGCGPLTAGLPLIAYLDANLYVGIDIRSSVLDMSWQQIGKAKLSGKNPRLIATSSFGIDLLGASKFDVIYSFSVLYHLSNELLVKCLSAVAGYLDLGGRYFANVNTETPSDRWLEFPFLRRTIADYEGAANTARLKLKVLGSMADLGFQLQGLEQSNLILSFELS